jgi:hypothetical protein
MNFYNETARKKYNLPNDWEWYKMEALGAHGKYDAVKLTGAVAPKKTRGKYKGRPNWRKLDKRTECAVVITDVDIGLFKAAYERTTFNCHECAGSGQVWCGWSLDDGNRFRACSRCNATGKAPAEAA